MYTNDNIECKKYFRAVTDDQCLTYKNVAKLYTYLRTRHASNLSLHNVQWKVTGQLYPTLIRKSRLRASVCWDNRELFLAARDWYGKDVDVKVTLIDDGNAEESSVQLLP